MMYTTYVTADHYIAKNELHKEIRELFKELNGAIVYEQHLTRFSEMVRERIAQLNQRHKRCKPFAIWEDMERDYPQHTKNISVSGVSRIEFLPVRGRFMKNGAVEPIQYQPKQEYTW